MPEKDKIEELEKRVDHHDWIINDIGKQLKTIESTLTSIDKHIKESNEFHTEYKFYSGELLKLQKQINDLPNKFVSKDQFKPVKSLVYGAVIIILTTVLTALIYLVVVK